MTKLSKPRRIGLGLMAFYLIVASISIMEQSERFNVAKELALLFAVFAVPAIWLAWPAIAQESESNPEIKPVPVKAPVPVVPVDVPVIPMVKEAASVQRVEEPPPLYKDRPWVGNGTSGEIPYRYQEDPQLMVKEVDCCATCTEGSLCYDSVKDLRSCWSHKCTGFIRNELLGVEPVEVGIPPEDN